jgi:hypothetical protein
VNSMRITWIITGLFVLVSSCCADEVTSSVPSREIGKCYIHNDEISYGIGSDLTIYQICAVGISGVTVVELGNEYASCNRRHGHEHFSRWYSSYPCPEKKCKE